MNHPLQISKSHDSWAPVLGLQIKAEQHNETRATTWPDKMASNTVPTAEPWSQKVDHSRCDPQRAFNEGDGGGYDGYQEKTRAT